MRSHRVLFGISFAFVAYVSQTIAFADEPKKSAPVPSAESARKMTLPPGFNVTLFAAEPDVVQPIAFTIDPRGRLWVVENYSYPVWLGGPQGRDRILIFEDTDGDGKHDKRTVFWDKGTNLTGIALGFGGAWICATPNLLFIPDANGDDVPDGPPVVKLDGWDTKAQHNMFNGLNWAPDGWLWGCNGILSNSRVGKPGTRDDKRVPINCGVWRYHPTREVFEVVATGTTNPWGLDFDQYGEAFITNCVIPHLFRVTPGSHFQRMFGQDFNPHLYELMPSCADHVHWDTVQVWSDIRTLGVTSTTDRAGGGHAHVGAMIYLGDNWPAEYRNNVFTCNIHGHRVNRDILVRKGSGDVAQHGKDFLLANDDWFRGLELKYGPDGAVYLTDWSDTGECHETDADNAHRENGRIYKIAYGKPAVVKVDLARMSDVDLVTMLSSQNAWYARTAQRLLQERRVQENLVLLEASDKILNLFLSGAETSIRLRALWAAHAIGFLNEPLLAVALKDKDERIRAWGVRFLLEEIPSLLQPNIAPEIAPPLPFDRFSSAARGAAKSDPSPVVRLALASSLQRLSPRDRWDLAKALLTHDEDAQDATIPLMLWYGIEPLVPTDRARAAALIRSCRIPLLRRFIARRVSLADEESAGGVAIGIDALCEQLATSEDRSVQRDILDGILDAFRGRKRVNAPRGWRETSRVLEKVLDPEIRLRTVLLSLLFGYPKAAETLQGMIADAAAPTSVRERALQAVVDAKMPGLAAKLQQLLDDRVMRGPVLRSLASVPDEATPKAILARYRTFSPEERDDAVATLASRVDFATLLLDRIADGTIPPRDLSVTTARQLQALNKPGISERLEKVWGSSRPTAKDKVALMARYKATLSSSKASDDPSRGRTVFNRTCQQCHKLYDLGGDIGPNLTGSDRANLDYILENVLDPSATVAKDYRLTTVATREGRVISGIIREQSDKTITMQTVNERIIVPRDEIEAIKESPVSMMPEGLLEKLSSEEVGDLMAYLASKGQVPAADEKTGK